MRVPDRRPFIDLFAPHRCAGCRRVAVALCDDCADQVGSPSIRAPVPGVRRIVAAWRYEGIARKLVLDLKVAGHLDAAVPLVSAMGAEVARRGLLGTAITWVPARPRDVLRRGFDHAEVLARGLARRVGLPCARLLWTTDARADQTTLGAAGRRRNLDGAFFARRCPAAVVLVDDVITTGATAAVCARALLGGGAEGVEAVVACSA